MYCLENEQRVLTAHSRTPVPDNHVHFTLWLSTFLWGFRCWKLNTRYVGFLCQFVTKTSKNCHGVLVRRRSCRASALETSASMMLTGDMSATWRRHLVTFSEGGFHSKQSRSKRMLNWSAYMPSVFSRMQLNAGFDSWSPANE